MPRVEHVELKLVRRQGRDTERAYAIEDDDGIVWLPKSQVDLDESDGTFTMPEWLAIEKGLV